MIVHLSSTTSGDSRNPAVIILHGLFGSSSNWRSIARQLSARFQVFCVDLRNHGKSGWNDSMSYLDMARDLAAFIAENHLLNPHLIGHSMGGKIVMAYLQHFASHVGKAVVIDIAPIAYTHDHDQLISALTHLDLAHIKTRGEADQRLSKDLSNASVRQFLLQNLIRKDHGFAWRVNLNAISKNTGWLFGYPEGQPSNAEVLFVRGGNSNYISPEHFGLVAKQFPNSSLQTLKNAGHWLHAEKPGELIELLFEFFKQQNPEDQPY